MKPIQYMVADKALSNKYTPIVVGVLVVGGVLASYFFIIKPILEGTGIKDTKFDKRLKYLKGFDPNYYKGNVSKVTISTATADKIATDIYKSYGFASAQGKSKETHSNFLGLGLLAWAGYESGVIPENLGNDDEKRLVGAVQSAGSDYNLSKVADTFQRKYNKNMAQYIMDFADNADTEVIYKTVKNW